MNYIDTAELKKIIKGPKKPLLLDVREVEEFEGGHIKGAVLIPWHTVAEKIVGIKKDKPIITYCSNVSRALKAAKTLEDRGYKNISVLRYGYEGWGIES